MKHSPKLGKEVRKYEWKIEVYYPFIKAKVPGGSKSHHHRRENSYKYLLPEKRF